MTPCRALGAVLHDAPQKDRIYPSAEANPAVNLDNWHASVKSFSEFCVGIDINQLRV
jgi:hypothetical protein